MQGLGGTVRDLLSRGQQSLLTDLDNLRPTLDSLRSREAELIPTFRSLITLGNSCAARRPATTSSRPASAPS